MFRVELVIFDKWEPLGEFEDFQSALAAIYDTENLARVFRDGVLVWCDPEARNV